ncbi:hypothetical protein OHS33_11235 [Streptomyces sp. NBC_00536]|uniref:hypothetical protein n=1 Tax=Streptomyces sp. NBC_00536 TaxID=2975769 RepID=UPI002E812211|nr:hypothetical protein [Streptomyces sp. NBC_00536]WUC78861.1 hypothetical protein OHS33_11235 [Streptomyces sp. NBC_00536]
MSRTAHHTRRRSTARRNSPPLTLTIHDLRFSARLRAEADRAGRRVRPQAVRRRAVVRRLPRVLGDPSVARWAAQEERRARARLRTAVRAAVRTAGTGDGGLDPDVRPARHRRAALWLA